VTIDIVVEAGFPLFDVPVATIVIIRASDSRAAQQQESTSQSGS
jgi:hypothetical protein